MPHQLCPIHAPGDGAPQYRPSSVPFAGSSEARDAFQRWELPPRAAGDPSGAGAFESRPKIPFEVRRRGCGHQCRGVRAAALPCCVVMTSAATGGMAGMLPCDAAGACGSTPEPSLRRCAATVLQGTTTNREAFTPKALEPRPAPSGYEYRPTSVPFTGTTEVREKYRCVGVRGACRACRRQ